MDSSEPSQHSRARPSLEEALALAEAVFEARKRRPAKVNPYAAAEAWHEEQRRQHALAWRSAVLYLVSIVVTVLQFGLTPQ